MTYLGVDYGQKHIGVAVAYEKQAEPLTSFPTPEATTRLAHLVTKHEVATVVVGLPSGRLVTYVQTFVAELKKHLSCRVVVWDETLSSQAADDSLLELGHTSKHRKQKQHTYAAMHILQSYLDAQ